jgi:hypothetical protein
LLEKNRLSEAKYAVFCVQVPITGESGSFHKPGMLVRGYITTSPFSIM